MKVDGSLDPDGPIRCSDCKDRDEGAVCLERLDRLTVALAILLLAWFGALPCTAQSPAPPATSPPAPGPARGDAEQTNVASRPSQKSPLEAVKPPAGGEVVQLPAPPLEPGDVRFPINLATALRLADARPLTIAAAQASAWVAEAQLQRAKVLWLPDFNLGFDYIRHDGFGPDTIRGVDIPSDENAFGQHAPGSFGRSQNQNINYFYAGGAFFLMRNSTDMLFEPLAARQHLNAKRWDIQTAKNDPLLMAARAYFEVHKNRGLYAGALDAVRKGRRLVEIINELRKGLVQPYEVDRARTLLADLEQRAVSHRQAWRRASADLTQILRLDPPP